MLRGLAASAGAPRLATSLSDGAAAQAVAHQADGGVVLWLANLTDAPQTVALEGLSGARGRIARLDLERFGALAVDPDALAKVADEGEVGRLDLEPYAVLRVAIMR